MQNAREFVISTDTSADLPFSFLDENSINLLALSYQMEGQIYQMDDRAIDQHVFYEAMRAGKMPTTMQLNPEQAEQSFEKLVEEGKDILHIAFSSGLSGTYNSTVMGANEVLSRHPEASIMVIDSFSASLGQGLLVYYAVQMKKAGKSLQEVASWVEGHRQNLIHLFTVEDLNHLHRGGRVSKTTAVVGTVLGIKPILQVDDSGRLVPIGKVRGRRQSLKDLVNRMGQKLGSLQNEVVFISHGDCLDEAQFCAEEIKKNYKIKNFVYNYVSPVIGAHSGPGTVAIFFLGKGRNV